MAATLKLSELISSLSYALDITEGQPEGHSIRSCWIGMHIGQGIGLPPQQLWDLYYAILLKDLGCSIALDDFGTGYSSLGYLRTLRFSTIKVDRSFVQGAATGNAESLAIIRAVVAMAQSLEMATTAEGVENIEEAKMIRELGCTKIQGYYFGRPMAAEEALSLFRNMIPARRGAVA